MKETLTEKQNGQSIVIIGVCERRAIELKPEMCTKTNVLLVSCIFSSFETSDARSIHWCLTRRDRPMIILQGSGGVC